MKKGTSQFAKGPSVVTHIEHSIVFSFWKKSLDLVGDILKDDGVRYCRVDGSLSLSQRKSVLSDFRDNSDIGVLIMTLGTGAVG